MNRITGKILLSCILLIVGVSNVFSQLKWDSLVGGKFQWSNAVLTMYADSNYLYVAGAYNEIGGRHMQGIARWNGRQWDSLGTGIEGNVYASGSAYPDNTWALTEFQNKLYVGGVFSSLGNINAPCIGTWNGVQWDSIPVQPFTNNYNSAVYSMTVINNKLYVGGEFDTVAGFRCIGITYWNGINWSNLNFGSGFSFRSINSI